MDGLDGSLLVPVARRACSGLHAASPSLPYGMCSTTWRKAWLGGIIASYQPRTVKPWRIGPTLLALAPHHLCAQKPISHSCKARPYRTFAVAQDPHRASLEGVGLVAIILPAGLPLPGLIATLVRHLLASLAHSHMALISVMLRWMEIPCRYDMSPA